ncbi:MAG: tetratricopeptide repeat protein [Planctomycetota bacterium]|jgi:tetratricopeptide (TPR) repeat protein
MKIIDVNAETKSTATRQVDTKYLSKDAGRVRIDPQTSSASRYVRRKTAPRTTGESRISRPASVTVSTEIASNPTRRLRGPGTTTTRDTDTAIVTASDLGTARTRIRRPREAESTIVVNGDNNVIVQGNVTASNPRPHIGTRRLRHDVQHYHHKPRWKSHSGFYFSFTWSNSSCGRVAYLPYRYHHSWCHYPIGYYPYYGLSYYYPRYHRKYIYVSLGGYWPSWYRYRRYYWYGCHPYYWYGATVIREPEQNVTYNTYNYYNTEPQPSGYGLSSSPTPYYDLGKPDPDKVDVPEYETAADLCFANAVELFEAGNYDDAVLQLREAVSISPDDIVLPFTYAQALFANGDYALAASVLREAIAQIPEDELTIYYPRGLYKDDAVLTEQIKQLEAATGKEPFDSDYQLLLGYQYLGIGKLDKAHQPLTKAAQSVANTSTAGKLLELAAKLQAETLENE